MSLRHLLAEDVPLELEMDRDRLLLPSVAGGSGRFVLAPLLLPLQSGLRRLLEAFAVDAHLELAALRNLMRSNGTIGTWPLVK